MSDSTYRGDTAEPAHGAPRGGPALVPVLTIASHPDPTRVGQQCRLPELLLGRRVGIGRLAPGFGDGRSLRDRFVSRSPIWLSLDSGDLVVDPQETSTTLQLDGAPATGPVRVSAAQLARGVVIELAERVVLVARLGNAAPPRAATGLILGVSDAIAFVRDEIGRVAQDDVPVLIVGESGTGKELVAQAVHTSSPRASRPLVSVNVAAIPESVAASELFGHARGAFTGATEAQPGWFGRADGGTLFLDEIGELPSAVQPLLLRALESGEVQPVGARAGRPVDVRLVSATDANLEAALQDGSFRTALFHRVAGYEIVVPPLRQRPEDIGLLLYRFLADALGPDADRLAEPTDGGSLWLPARLVARLLRYEWPGNVRQLRNVARRLVIASQGSSVAVFGPSVERLLASGSVPDTAGRPSASATHVPAAARGVARAAPTDLTTIDEPTLLGALRASGWRIADTARALGISRNSLYRLMDACPAIRKARDLSAEELHAAAGDAGGDTALMAERLQVSERGLLLRARELGLKL